MRRLVECATRCYDLVHDKQVKPSCRADKETSRDVRSDESVESSDAPSASSEESSSESPEPSEVEPEESVLLEDGSAEALGSALDGSAEESGAGESVGDGPVDMSGIDVDVEFPILSHPLSHPPIMFEESGLLIGVYELMSGMAYVALYELDMGIEYDPESMEGAVELSVAVPSIMVVLEDIGMDMELPSQPASHPLLEFIMG